MVGRDRGRRGRWSPSVASLEGRTLLSGYTGLSRMRNLATNTGVYNVRIDGPGFLKVHQLPRGVVDLNVLGTTSGSTLTVSLVRPRPHKIATLLPVQQLNVISRQLGSINAGAVLLAGAMTPLSNSVGLMSFGAQRFSQFLKRFHVARGQRHSGSRGGQRSGARAADSPAGSCDECGSVCHDG